MSKKLSFKTFSINFNVNFLLKLICQENGLIFIDNSNLVTEDLWKKGLQLFNREKSTLAYNFISHLNNFYQLEL